jgi:segregation and condensation protein A
MQPGSRGSGARPAGGRGSRRVGVGAGDGPEGTVEVYLAHGVQEADAAQFRGHPVHLETFEGPLDLLLHLIKRDQVEIWEISVARITRQYLDYLATLQALNIEVAGDFLVMAATLMRIKSQNLLPRPSALPETDEGMEPLTREGLIARLVEYKKYREAARSLLRMEASQLRRHPVGAASAVGAGHAYPLREPRLIDLFEYLRDLLDRKEPTPGHHVHLEEIRLEDQLEWVRDRLGAEEAFEKIPGGPGNGIPFTRLLRRPWLRMEIAVTFLAILELARLQQLQLWQRRALEEIWVLARSVREVAAGPSLPEADEEMI